jgi:hypothetical protein
MPRRAGGLSRRPVCTLALAALICLSGGVAASGKSKAPPAPRKPSGPRPVYVFPIPGSHFASPATQITFRGLPAARLGTITVTGSASGIHAGSVVADSDLNGGSFVPSSSEPFTAGEIVTVSTSLNIEGAGNGIFQFQVATPAGPLAFSHRPAARRVNGDVWRYRSRPDLAPAAVTIIKPAPAAPGDVFLAPQIGPLQQGPEIIGPNGGLIWFNPVPTDTAATDFRVQIYHGRRVLTWWQGNETAGVGAGQDMILNSSYQLVKTVSAANGQAADLHEFQLTPSGTALITAEYPVYVNAAGVHGSTQEVVLDSVVQEIDVPTGLVVFQWDSLDHVPLTAGYTKLPTGAKPNTVYNPYDYFHVNSVELDRDGNLVLSGRNTWAVYKVDRQTAATIWTLGGKQSTFKLGPGAAFAFQHDVRVRAIGDSLVTMFDDGAGPPFVHSQSRALELRLSVKHMTATVVAERVHSPPLLSAYEGDSQALPDRDDFIGWGQQPFFSEYDPQGKLVFEGRFVDANISYRAYRFAWNGTPTTPPAVATARRGRKMTVFVSWNGASNVGFWRVLAGDRANALRPVATAPKRGFETDIQTKARGYVAIQALDSKGHPLARSSVQHVA